MQILVLAACIHFEFLTVLKTVVLGAREMGSAVAALAEDQVGPPAPTRH